MTIPSQPLMTLTAVSSTSFQALIIGADPTATVQLYYIPVGGSSPTTGPSQTGNGTLTVSGLKTNSAYIVYVIASAGSGYSLPSVGVISLATTDSLAGALTFGLANNPGFAALCPQVWKDEIPATINQATINLPWTIISVESEEPDLNFESTGTTNFYNRCKCKVEIFAAGADACEQIRLAAEAAIAYQTLPFQTATTIQVLEESIRSGSDWTLARNGQKVFHTEITWSIFMTRP